MSGYLVFHGGTSGGGGNEAVKRPLNIAFPAKIFLLIISKVSVPFLQNIFLPIISKAFSAKYIAPNYLCFSAKYIDPDNFITILL